MWTVFKRNLKDFRVPLLVYSIAAILFEWMYVAIYPSIARESERMTELLKNYPEGFMKAFGLDANTLTFTNVESFLSMENFSMIWPIVAIAMAVSLASNAIAGEIEKGTIVLTLSQPISRVKIFWSRYLMGAASLVLFAILSVFSIVPLAKLHHVSYRIDHHVTMFVLAVMFALAIYSLTWLLSVIFSEKGKVSFILIAIIVLMYALKIVSALKDSLSDLRYASFLYYFDQNKALVDNSISWQAFAVFLSTILISVVSAMIIFSKRDISA